MLLECDANVNTWEARTTGAYDHAALHNLQHLLDFLGKRVGQENVLIVSLLFLCLMFSDEKTHTLPAGIKKKNPPHQWSHKSTALLPLLL